MPSRSIYFYASAFAASVLLNAHSTLGFDNYTDSLINCSNFTSCGECTTHLECGFCVPSKTCVQAGWKGPFEDPKLCPTWDYEYAQCFERVPLLGDTIATHHFRRASYYNYNRNRPFERRGRTLSTGTANSTVQYGRNWRNGTDDYMYGYGGPTTPSMLWVNDSPVPTDYHPMGSHNSSLGNTGEWRRWEKKREELLAKYAKSNNEG
ncbi:19944_t:CDS:2 [Racocetra persica]|uniref:19944_t:CDS:1 n=1 Tax=Racocetra persica TaxID=160502 RepID=A0ACA9MY91_9GLOM|nr:19944_t:CDS:2 [Racocetra persica]